MRPDSAIAGASRRDGRLLHAEDLRFCGKVAATLEKPGVTGGAIAMVTLLLVHADAADLIDPLRRATGDRGGVSAIRSSADDRLVAHLTAEAGLGCGAPWCRPSTAAVVF